MSAEMFVTGLNALYLIPMGVLSVIGSATMLKLASTFLVGKYRRSEEVDTSVEDA